MKKKSIKTIIALIIVFILVGFAGYRLGIYPVGIVKESAKQISENAETVKEQIQELPAEDIKTADNLQEEIEKNLDIGMQSNESKKEESDATDFEKSLECFYVESVVDGDTIWVSNDNHPKGIKVRYIGIDTPESVHDDASKNTPEGKIASDRNKELIKEAGYDVYLEFDQDTEDTYGRTLAYVYVFDFDSRTYTMLEEVLLKEGLCKTMSIAPNTKYAEEFAALEKTAKEEKAGFWGTGFYK